MSETTMRVPAAVAGDPSDVATALEVAGALWEKGSREDAIRWIKRAVDAATEAGQNERADALTTSVVELERASAAPAVQAAPEPAAPHEPREETAAIAPAPPPPLAATAPAASSSSVPKAPPAPIASRPPVPSTSPRAATDPPPLPAAASRAPAPHVKPAASVSPRPTSQPVPSAAASRGRATAPPQTAVVAARQAPVRLPTGQRIRVSVKASVRDPSLLVVRPLAEGRPLPLGTREGFLVLEDEEADDTHSHANGSAPS
jgi:hypothetical protein